MSLTRLLAAAVVALVPALLPAHRAQSAFTPYNDSASFFAALVNDFVVQETYESEDVSTLIPDGGTLNGLTYDFPEGLEGRIDDTFANLGSRGLAAERDGIPGAEPDGFDFFFPGDSITISLPVFTRAFGAFISSAVTDSVDYSISVAGQGSVPTNGMYDADVAPAPFYFVGLISDTAFTQATISAALTAGGGYTVDNVTYVVPGPGDVNGDGVVDIFDVNLVSAHWGETGPIGDANGDMMVDIFDVNLISANWSAGGAAAVPEPGSLVLLLAGAAMVGCLRRFDHVFHNR
jgi:hypothetical protein